MKKVINKGLLLILFSSSILLANSNPWAKIQSNNNLQKATIYAKKINISFLKNKVFKSFPEVTGDKENFDKYLQRAEQDIYLKEAIALLYNTSLWKETDIRKKKVKIPEYKKALQLLAKSVRKNKNVLSSYLGFSIITNSFMRFISHVPKKTSEKYIVSDIIEKYFPIFNNLLLEKKYCIAYLYQMKYLWYYQQNYKKAYSIGKKGVPVCKQQYKKKKIPYWIDSSMRVHFVKLKTFINYYQNSSKWDKEVK